jgi:hypothetical protein
MARPTCMEIDRRDASMTRDDNCRECMLSLVKAKQMTVVDDGMQEAGRQRQPSRAIEDVTFLGIQVVPALSHDRVSTSFTITPIPTRNVDKSIAPTPPRPLAACETFVTIGLS